MDFMRMTFNVIFGLASLIMVGTVCSIPMFVVFSVNRARAHQRERFARNRMLQKSIESVAASASVPPAVPISDYPDPD